MCSKQMAPRASLIDLPLLQEKINYNFTKGAWKSYKLVEKGRQKGIQVSKDDEIIKESLNVYKLKPQLFDKAVKIYDFRISKKLVNEPKALETSRQ